MTAPTIQVDGVKELTRALKELGDRELSAALKAANKTISDQVVRKALPNVPVGKTGMLKASLKPLATPRAATVKAGSAKVRYAKAIHYGTKARKGMRGPHNIKARPFLTAAAATVSDRAKSTYLTEINRIARKAGL